MTEAVAQRTRACADFVSTAATRAIEENIESISNGRETSRLIVLWGPSGYGKTENLLHLNGAFQRRRNRSNASVIEPQNVHYRGTFPDDIMALCQEFRSAHGNSWQLLLLDFNKQDVNNDSLLSPLLIDNLLQFIDEEFNTTIVLASQRTPTSEELSGSDRVLLIEVESFNQEELTELIRKKRNPIALHVDVKLSSIYEALKTVSPKVVKFKLNSILQQQNEDELDELLRRLNIQLPESEQGIHQLQEYSYVSIWKAVSFVGEERFTKDFFTWIVRVYHAMYENSSTYYAGITEDISGKMIGEFIRGRFLKQANEGGSDYYTLINICKDLKKLRQEDGSELKYFRVFLYALFHMIEKDLRFHVIKRDKPLEINLVKNIAEKVLLDPACRRLADTSSQQLNDSPEVKFQYIGLEAAVVYIEVQSTADTRPRDITRRVNDFREVLVKSNRMYNRGRYQPATDELINAVQLVHKFSKKDVKFLNDDLNAGLYSSGLPYQQFDLLSSDFKQNWCHEEKRFLLDGDTCSKLYVGEIHAWIITVYGKLLKKYQNQSTEIREKNPLKFAERSVHMFERALAVYDYLRRFLREDTDLLQRVILARDELVLENAMNDQTLNDFRERYQDEVRKLHFDKAQRLWEDPYDIKRVLAYENGVVRSDLLTDKYHKICCHEKMIQIDRIYIGKTPHVDRLNIPFDDIITNSSDHFREIRALICATLESAESGENWIEESCRRMYAYCLEGVALFLLDADYREESFRLFAYALDMFHSYLNVPIEELAAKLQKEKKYIDICRAIKSGDRLLVEVHNPLLTDAHTFKQCICWPISSDDRCDCARGDCERCHCTRCAVENIAMTRRGNGMECVFQIICNYLQPPVADAVVDAVADAVVDAVADADADAVADAVVDAVADPVAGAVAGAVAEMTHETSKNIAAEALNYLQHKIRPPAQN